MTGGTWVCHRGLFLKLLSAAPLCHRASLLPHDTNAIRVKYPAELELLPAAGVVQKGTDRLDCESEVQTDLPADIGGPKNSRVSRQ